MTTHHNHHHPYEVVVYRNETGTYGYAYRGSSKEHAESAFHNEVAKEGKVIQLFHDGVLLKQKPEPISEGTVC